MRSWPFYYGLLMSLTALTAVVLLVHPASLTSHYEEVYMADPTPSQRPKISICLSMPFVASKLRAQGVSSSLASFMLYSLSPFLPNPEILVCRSGSEIH